MTGASNVKLLPLPEPMQVLGDRGRDAADAWCRANVAHATAAKDAANEALQAEVRSAVEVAQEGARLVAQAAAQRDAEKARAERLAEALREAMEWNWLDDDARPSPVGDLCDDALRNHVHAILPARESGDA